MKVGEVGCARVGTALGCEGLPREVFDRRRPRVPPQRVHCAEDYLSDSWKVETSGIREASGNEKGQGVGVRSRAAYRDERVGLPSVRSPTALEVGQDGGLTERRWGAMGSKRV